jgi:ankyrin repeat protein
MSAFSPSLLSRKMFSKTQPLSDADLMAFRAAKADDYDTLTRALQIGAKPNAIGAEGETPVCVAAFNGNARMIRVLAAAGGDVDAAVSMNARRLQLQNRLLGQIPRNTTGIWHATERVVTFCSIASILLLSMAM